MSRLRSYAPMKSPPSDLDPKVYAEVDRRSENVCEVVLEGVRCRKAGTAHHHTVKPRSEHHTIEEVMRICYGHHDRVDWPFSRGRLQTLPNGDGTFRCAIVTAPDKFTYRQSGGS